MIHKSILSIIGKTPMAAVNRLNPNPRVTMAVKLEARNPGGSIKDRVAAAMIEAAEASGELTPDKTVIEATSGNTGIGLAMVCAVKGYRLMLLMPDSASEERKRIMRAYGAEIRLTPGRLGTDGAIEEAYRLAREEPETYVLMDQFNNPASVEAHRLGTAREIWEDSEGQVTHVVIALGTSGTVMGCVAGLKELSPAVKIVAVEPLPGHKIQGLKNMQESYPPGIYDKRVIDSIVRVTDEEAFATARRLAAEEGILAGMSGGAAMAAALRLAAELDEGLVVVILADGGERYLSTSLFAPAGEKGLALFNVAAGEKTFLDPTGTKPGFFTFGPCLAEPGEAEAWRRIVLLDVLRRHAADLGGEAALAVGLADMDDRALEAAREAGLSREAFAEAALGRVRELGRDLGLSEGVRFPLAGAAAPLALELARKLVGKGLAYEKLRSVYFDVARDKQYGRLLRADHTKWSLGKTVDLAAYLKENPRDFTLLKRVSLQDLKLGDALQTDWGNVRPTWFLQMAAAALSSLPAVSVAFAGEDKCFPHLENLRSIWSLAAGVSPKVWMVGGLACDKRREAGGGAPDLLALLDAGVHPLTLRLWLLSTAYRKPLVLTDQSLGMWEANRLKLQEAAAGLAEAARSGKRPPEAAPSGDGRLRGALAEALADDLGLRRFWPALFAFCRETQAALAVGGLAPAEASARLADLSAVNGVLGFLDQSALPLPEEAWPAEAAALAAERQAARAARDYPAADALRARLAEAGFRVEDAPGGPRLYRTR